MSTNFHNLCHMCTALVEIYKLGLLTHVMYAICVIVLHLMMLFTAVLFWQYICQFSSAFYSVWKNYMAIIYTLLSGLGPTRGTSLRVSHSAMVADVLIKRVASHSACKKFHINVDSRDVEINCVHVYGHLIRWHFFWKLECLVLWYCVISHTCVNRIKNVDFFHAVY